MIRFGSDFGRFWVPKTLPKIDGDAPPCRILSWLFFGMISCVRVCVFRASESVRVCRPGAAPGAPKRPQDPPKSTQRGSKRPPRVLQEAPRGPQETQEPVKRTNHSLKSLFVWHVIIVNALSPSCMSEKQANFKYALLRCRATGWRTGMPKHGGRAAVSPQRGRQ